MNLPLHPFVDYHSDQISIKEEHPEIELTKELFENLQLKPISHQEIVEKKKQVSKPKSSEDSKDKQYPKIRVSLNVLNQLKKFQKQLKCKSYCEVVMKLMEYYDCHDNSLVNKSDD